MMIIDFHSHLLPCVDHGSQSIEESIEMLRIMKSQGIDAVVATPHFYADEEFPEEFLKRRKVGAENLMKAIEGLAGEDFPHIYLGAEVAYYRGMS
ncbi:MAG: capsular polysaccharide biosynthesis protein, partial [Firmicutes bacterium]|nr:capsular polysaccharide biosynthesis protein [Bacillota bacterium]